MRRNLSWDNRNPARPRFDCAPVAIALAFIAALAGCAGANDTPTPTQTAPTSAAPPGGPCGADPSTLRPITHVIVVMEENLSPESLLGDPGSPNDKRSPFLNELARTCGLATNFRAITQPSHPNYIALAAGDTYIPAGCHKIKCILRPLDEPSIFGQLQAAGMTWRVYAEDIPSPCALDAKGEYETGHNPAIWFLPIRDECMRSNVDTTSLVSDLGTGNLPSFAWILPNDSHNGHTSEGGKDRSITIADAWLKARMAGIVASPQFADGSTVVMVTWDEGNLTGSRFNRNCLRPALAEDISCRVATIVASRWVPPGTTSALPFSHYSILKTAERLLGLPLLAHAADPGVSDMIRAFGLGRPTG